MFTIDGRMDAELHTSIHQVEFLATVEFYWSDRPWITLQQENDPKDTESYHSPSTPHSPSNVL